MEVISRLPTWVTTSSARRPAPSAGLSSSTVASSAPPRTPQSAATSVEYTPSIFVMKPLADFGPTVGPLVGPVTAPKLDGTKDLKATQTGGDPDNTQLSWTAPSTGSATFYEVYVYRLTSAASQTAISSEARIVTTGTSVTIPPAILISGTYFFTIRAFHAPGSDVTTKPEIRGATYGWADMVSGKVTF